MAITEAIISKKNYPVIRGATLDEFEKCYSSSFQRTKQPNKNCK